MTPSEVITALYDYVRELICELEKPIAKFPSHQELNKSYEESYIYLSTGKTSIVARVGANEEPPLNQKMDVVFDMQKAHFFDLHTEETVV